MKAYAAELDFLVVSCQPCDTRHKMSALEILSANSGYLIILFKPEYSGTFSLFVHEGQITKESFLLQRGAAHPRARACSSAHRS